MLCTRSRVPHTVSIWSECIYAAVVTFFFQAQATGGLLPEQARSVPDP